MATTTCTKWHPPTGNTLKCNTDTTTFAELGLIGLGACLRNNQGHLVGFRMNSKRGGFSIAEGEDFSLLEALKWAQQQDLHDVLFESDAKAIVDSLKSNDTNYIELGDLMKECKSILTSCPNFVVTHIGRSGNSVAHLLARRS
ncbi:hypothetical protein LINPERHAP2_LOCUS25312 [Linum perenne]